MTSSAGDEHEVQDVNAFTKLMAAKPKLSEAKATPAIISEIPGSHGGILKSRHGGLAIYIHEPTCFPPTTVVSHTSDFVIIKDLYPKSTVHLLVLPRSQAKTQLHPFAAFDGSDPTFLASARAECDKAKRLAASELRRIFGKYSAQDQEREAAISSSEPENDVDSELPPGRDWSASIMVGVHAVPSMSNLHIHVISVDRHSEAIKHRKHYNSFATPFFVPLEDFPLAEDDVRRWPGRERYLKWDFKCWRCGTGFGNEFAKLKKHLDVEFEEWRNE